MLRCVHVHEKVYLAFSGFLIHPMNVVGAKLKHMSCTPPADLFISAGVKKYDQKYQEILRRELMFIVWCYNPKDTSMGEGIQSI